MTGDVKLLSLPSLPAPIWDALVPGRALQHRYDYLRCRLSALAPGATSAEEIREALGAVLVCRYFDQSRISADQALDAGDRAAAIQSIASRAQDVVRDGLAGAVAFPFVLRSDRMLRDRLRRLGFSSGIITAHTTTSLPEDAREINDYLPSLSKNGRRRFRTELARLRQVGITVKTIPLPGNELAVEETY